MVRSLPLPAAVVAAVVAAVGATIGCGPASTFTPREGVCSARPPRCDFEVISRRPARDYQVIGTIDLEAFSVRRLPNDEAELREAVGPEVCRAGGDAIIPGITGDGRYVLAAVVKWVDEGETAPVCGGREHPRGSERAARAPGARAACDGDPSC